MEVNNKTAEPISAIASNPSNLIVMSRHVLCSKNLVSCLQKYCDPKAKFACILFTEGNHRMHCGTMGDTINQDGGRGEGKMCSYLYFIHC